MILKRLAVRWAVSLRWWKYRILQKLISDQKYISWQFGRRIGKPLNLADPLTFNEKIQWLKLNYRSELVTQCADKYRVRDFVSSRIGPEILNELYAVYDSVDEIDLATLPDAFVLKVNHGCKQNILCPDKNKLDWDYAAGQLDAWMNNNYYFHSREWAYKNITPKIICEKFLVQDEKGLRDYKFFCFNGIPRYIEAHSDRFGAHYKQVYDVEWNKVSFQRGGYSRPSVDIEKPLMLDKMKEYAARLSEGFPFARVDFYCIGTQVIFGEITFYPASGYNPFYPVEYDLILGNELQLPIT